MVVRRKKNGNWEGGIRISTLNAYSSGEMQGQKWVEQLTTFEGKPANIWVRNMDGSGTEAAFPAERPGVGSLPVLSSCATYSNTTYTIYCYYANAQDYANMNATCTPYGTTNYFTFCGSEGGGGNPDENDNWAPEGGEGGNSWPSNDPCDYARNHVALLNDFMQSSLFADSKTQILNADPTKEHSFVYGRNGGTKTRSSMQTCSTGTECQVQVSWPGAFADLHNHPNSFPPSPGDIYGLINIHNSNPAYNARFVMSADGTVIYGLLIADSAKANLFRQNHPQVNSPHGYDFPQSFYDHYETVYDYFYLQGATNFQADEAALAYTLDYFDSGILLLKSEAGNGLKRKLTTKNISNGSYINSICN